MGQGAVGGIPNFNFDKLDVQTWQKKLYLQAPLSFYVWAACTSRKEGKKRVKLSAVLFLWAPFVKDPFSPASVVVVMGQTNLVDFFAMASLG